MENTSLLKKRTYGSLSLGGSYGTSKRGDMRYDLKNSNLTSQSNIFSKACSDWDLVLAGLQEET